MQIRSLLAALVLLAAAGRAAAETPEEYRAKVRERRVREEAQSQQDQ